MKQTPKKKVILPVIPTVNPFRNVGKELRSVGKARFFARTRRGC